jgi:D-alanine-D-alanine ligase-like ATP-grasp enzyme
MPGFTEDSLYPKMLEASGIPTKTLIKELVAGAL